MQEIPQAPEDGRQSETAAQVSRGVRRLLRAHGLASVTEMPLPGGRRADIVALAPDGQIVIVEIKSSMADFQADLKWPEYRHHCDRLYFAIPVEVSEDAMPDDAGLIVADAFGAAFVRTAPDHRLAGATRRSMLLRFGHFAADRLHRLRDAGLQD